MTENDAFVRTFSHHRSISGAELAAFLALPIARGLPQEKAGNFRGDDLVEWLDNYGWATTTYTEED